jgi:nitrogen fixation protein FixH
MRSEPREFTGRHMLFSMLAFFGVIIAVNLTMATLAGRSWTGLVVKNSYVASQEFNGKVAAARAQAALGWTPTLAVGNGRVSYSLVDASGHAVVVAGATVAFKRPSYEAEDMVFVLAPMPGHAAEAAGAVRDGIWIVEIAADAGQPEPYRETRRVVIADGFLR